MGVLEDLQAKVGDEIGVGEWFTVDQERIDTFADATGDHQWIHVDQEKAKQGPFGTTIAHGFLTLSLIPAIAPGILPEGIKMAINYGADRIRFISPVPAGSRVRARTALDEVKEVTGGVQIKTVVTIEIEGGAKPACVAETLTRFYV